ncbi:MAG: hypothetical protein JWL59_4366 [Chthoniobacteraceae bacterium]|nr:hypothetical protein [Chthoniobacteraceae bacterium]
MSLSDSVLQGLMKTHKSKKGITHPLIAIVANIMNAKTKLSSLALSDLKPHPLNQLVYRHVPIDHLAQDIRNHGLQERLMVTPDSTMIDGWRRGGALSYLERTLVPVCVKYLYDATEIEIAILQANKNREKSNEERLREFGTYMRIFKSGTLADQIKSLEMQGGFAEYEPNFIRDYAAAQVGLQNHEVGPGYALLEALEARRLEIPPDSVATVRTALNSSIAAGVSVAAFLNIISPENAASFEARLESTHPPEIYRRDYQDLNALEDRFIGTGTLKAAELTRNVEPSIDHDNDEAIKFRPIIKLLFNYADGTSLFDSEVFCDRLSIKCLQNVFKSLVKDNAKLSKENGRLTPTELKIVQQAVVMMFNSSNELSASTIGQIMKFSRVVAPKGLMKYGLDIALATERLP